MLVLRAWKSRIVCRFLHMGEVTLDKRAHVVSRRVEWAYF
jgi:hypothetical protein